MELQLGLALASPGLEGLDLELNCYDRSSNGGTNKRRSSSPLYASDDFSASKRSSPSDRGVPRTLALLPRGRSDMREDDDDFEDSEINSFAPNSSSSKYVKVTMEGVGIGRKVDLSIHHNFRSLQQTLMLMFGLDGEDSEGYKLTFQDMEGDWVLAEDVTWRDFIRTVQRLRVVKS